MQIKSVTSVFFYLKGAKQTILVPVFNPDRLCIPVYYSFPTGTSSICVRLVLGSKKVARFT